MNYIPDFIHKFFQADNWIFGISIAMCTLLIFQTKQFDLSKFDYAKIIYKGIVIYSMLTIFFAGLSKYLILNRENKIAIYYGVLLKLFVLKDNKTENEFKEEWNTTFGKWVIEHNKLKLMAQGLNISIIMTLILVFLAAILILFLI